MTISKSSSRSRVLATAEYSIQQQSLLADVDAQIALRQSEHASLSHEINDLQNLAKAIRSGLVILEGDVAEFEQQQIANDAPVVAQSSKSE